MINHWYGAIVTSSKIYFKWGKNNRGLYFLILLGNLIYRVWITGKNKTTEMVGWVIYQYTAIRKVEICNANFNVSTGLL